MFLLSSISRGSEFWSVHHASIYESSDLKLFLNIKFFGEVSSNWQNDFLGTNFYKTLESCG